MRERIYVPKKQYAKSGPFYLKGNLSETAQKDHNPFSTHAIWRNPLGHLVTLYLPCLRRPESYQTLSEFPGMK